MNLASALFRAMRPHQWTKNLFVFAPLLFAGQVGKEGVLLRVVAAFGIFCIMASSIYLINDVFDREADRLHPRKKHRPIASGALPVGAAIAFSALLATGGLVWAYFGLCSIPVTTVCLAYLTIQFLYTWRLKHIVILDVLCISSGFVLRLLAGGGSSWAALSQWIVLCTVFLSLFLALCKRRHEVTSLGAEAGGHRATLEHYPVALLDQLISVAVAATLVMYSLYTVDVRTLLVHRLVDRTVLATGQTVLSPLLLTIPFVLFGLCRYLYLVYRKDLGGSPTTTLLRDPASLVNGVLYAATLIAIFRFGA